MYGCMCIQYTRNIRHTCIHTCICQYCTTAYMDGKRYVFLITITLFIYVLVCRAGNHDSIVMLMQNAGALATLL